MSGIDRKKFLRFELIYVAAYLLIVSIIWLFGAEGYTLRAVAKSIHGLMPLVGFSFIISAYFLSPRRYWMFLLTFTLLLLGMLYSIYEVLHDFPFWTLFWAAWVDTRVFVYFALPFGIIITLLKFLKIYKQNPFED